MPRRLILACLALTLAIGTAQAQVRYGNDVIPTRPELARVNLDLKWVGVVPLLGPEKLTQLSIDAGMLFAQTNSANFYAYNAESGQLLWTTHLGRVTVRAQGVAVNSTMVFVSNSNQLYALDRATGRQVWSQNLTDNASSAPTANDDYVMLGTADGKLEVFDAKDGKIAWNIQTNAKVSSRPIIAGPVVAFASEDKKIYLSRTERSKLFWRFATGAPVVAPLASHGTRTLLATSTDNSLFAIDLFTGVGLWNFATGAPVEQEPIVAGDDIFVVNKDGMLTSVDISNGLSRWTISTLGGRFISVSGTKIYLESHDDDLMVVDRKTGKMIYDPAMTLGRAGIDLREYSLGVTNRFDDRLYFGTSHGLIICLREMNQVEPLPLRDPNAKPFGYIPPEGYDISVPVTPLANPTPVEETEPK
ncbi:PQQ-binding-like beta-propeller repeat protein [Tundrisphaera lichenicola]|uniref:PQQ-binding-like beta-propeller repeat protein n=1 Tax=Tundrisphaera lichenicola TaxID=2029860 RepID=UPI003EBDE7A5